MTAANLRIWSAGGELETVTALKRRGVTPPFCVVGAAVSARTLRPPHFLFDRSCGTICFWEGWEKWTWAVNARERGGVLSALSFYLRSVGCKTTRFDLARPDRGPHEDYINMNTSSRVRCGGKGISMHPTLPDAFTACSTLDGSNKLIGRLSEDKTISKELGNIYRISLAIKYIHLSKLPP